MGGGALGRWRGSHYRTYVRIAVDWKYEVYCECRAGWWVLADVDDPDELDSVECLACGETVFDVRRLAEKHSAGRDVELTDTEACTLKCASRIRPCFTPH
jgi:hypothetical protein